MMQLALYKGPATDWRHKLAHWGICAFATLSRSWEQRRWSPVIHSHCELVIDGWCYSASARDGGVRRKVVGKEGIDLDNGRWDVLPVPEHFDREAALAWFFKHMGWPYDWLGVARFAWWLRWLPRNLLAYFCSEALAAALGLHRPDKWRPDTLPDAFSTTTH